MTILLVGEYSRLHNSLKEGLVALGHQVTLVSSGDGFKKFPADYSYEPKWSQNIIVNIVRQLIFKIFKYDLAEFERGLRFSMQMKNFKNFDVVQLINEQPIKTHKKLELKLLKKLFNQNKKVYLLSCGVDYRNVEYLLQNKLRYSIMTPYFEDKNNAKEYQYILDYQGIESSKISRLVEQHISGIIASDIDYIFALEHHNKFRGLIPNPVNLNDLEFESPIISDKITLFLGINEWTYIQKGISIFEEALKIIQQKFADKVEIIVTRSVPYAEYINSYNKAHILLDQVYAYDQGYNALEAMAKGKVVFTGAETEFMNHYNLTERVAVNALPNAEAIAKELEYLILNPHEILAIGKRARAFVEKEHDYLKVAKMYLDVWNKNYE